MQSRVVKQHDAPRLHLGRYPLVDLARRQLFPVKRVGVPLHRRKSHAVHGADDIVVILAVRTAKQRRPHAGDRLDLIVAGAAAIHLIDDLFCGELCHVRVRIGMVHHLVSGVVERLYALRIFVHPLADNKERCPHAVLCQYVDEHLRIFVAPGRVERKAHEFSVPLHAVNGQLPLRDRRADDARRVYECEDRRDCEHERRAGSKFVLP